MPASRNARIITVLRRPNSWQWQLHVVDFGDTLFAGYTPTPEPQNLRNFFRVLSRSEVERVRTELEGINFWTARQFVMAGVDDGIAMTIEGRSGDKYRAITRLNEWDGTERFACALFDLAGLLLPDHPRCPEPLPAP